jgi:hypothetical protein
MDDWHQAIFDFWEANSGKPWLTVAPTGNCSFNSIVEFRSDRRNITVRTTAKLTRNGQDDGVVSLNEAKGFSADDYHTLFRRLPPSTCEYDASNNALLIRGDSPKKMGNYEVRIRPDV